VYTQIGKSLEEEYLSNKITNNTAIINAHPGSISIEDSSNPDLNSLGYKQ
jgi:hypothetical protein